ncbi:hypothetical protein OH76DRAFT_603367 [Lentinus brumalis]|uniref:Uncharacterized protein n=1 Tax=Lentinus brumalis TaxID=2498619 RepID=A0A371DUP7_9APHY|nr:hypothetical protein OH76DRAFT_603367 [Polyporus brumalis]
MSTCFLRRSCGRVDNMFPLPWCRVSAAHHRTWIASSEAKFRDGAAAAHQGRVSVRVDGTWWTSRHAWFARHTVCQPSFVGIFMCQSCISGNQNTCPQSLTRSGCTLRMHVNSSAKLRRAMRHRKHCKCRRFICWVLYLK